ncbi:MAG: hypothetical protein ACRECY_08135 [Phyllobacterium sp.]
MQIPVWTKPAVNGVVLGAIATMIIGFTWGGWTTAGTAKSMAETAAKDASTRIVASICVNKFAATPDAKAQLAALKEESTWKRGDFIEKGGWSTIVGVEDVKGAASACASDLVAMDELPTPVVQPNVVTDPNAG